MCVAPYRQVHNFVHIILKKKTGRERKRYFGEKRIYHPTLPVSNNFVSLILVWFKSMFSKYVQSNLKSIIKSLLKQFSKIYEKESIVEINCSS